MIQNAANWNTFFEQAALSDVGLRRANNQDSFAAVAAGDEQEWRRRGHLFIVADGMGAHAAGELASKLACSGISHTYHKLLDRPPQEALHQAFVETNAHIHGRGEANAEFQGMGTTSTVLLLLPEGAVAAHVGDSRIYRLRGDRLDQLTFDHSLVWEMMASGQLPAGEVPSFVPKNIITRSLGPHATVQVDLEGPFPLEPGDTFLLCSDGLSGQVTDEEIGAILGALPPAQAAQALVDLANLRGGPDNITVQVVRILEPPARTAADSSAATASSRDAAPATAFPAVLWIVSGLCLLAAIVLLVLNRVVPAILSALGALVAVTAGLLRHRFAPQPKAPSLPPGPFGRGPHVSKNCAPGEKIATAFLNILEQLERAAMEERWQIDWTRFKTFSEAAHDARRRSDYRESVRQATLALTFLMAEIREQRTRNGSRAVSSPSSPAENERR